MVYCRHQLVFGFALVLVISAILILKQYSAQYEYEEEVISEEIAHPDVQRVRVVSMLRSVTQAMRRLVNMREGVGSHLHAQQGISDDERSQMVVVKAKQISCCCICLEDIQIGNDVLSMSCAHEVIE